MDGASQFQILFKVMLPISLPALATVTLFTVVAHWNNWFDGSIYYTSGNTVPLQTYIYQMINHQRVKKNSFMPYNVFYNIEKFDEQVANELMDRVMRMWCVVIAASHNELSINDMHEVYSEFLMENAFVRFEQWNRNLKR